MWTFEVMLTWITIDVQVAFCGYKFTMHSFTNFTSSAFVLVAFVTPLWLPYAYKPNTREKPSLRADCTAARFLAFLEHVTLPSTTSRSSSDVCPLNRRLLTSVSRAVWALLR
jgi:hypothetical protein